MLTEPLRLECREIRQTLEGGLTQPRYAAAMDESGVEFKVVLKFREPDGPKNSNYGGTSLACELLCAAIGRLIGIPVPEYAIVTIGEALSGAMPTGELQSLVKRNLGENFGTVYQEGFGLWTGHRAVSENVRDVLENVLAFDCAVLNGDRSKSKPNLLNRGDELLAIDHSLALFVHQMKPEAIEESPIFEEPTISNHCAAAALKDHKLPFTATYEAWVKLVSPEELAKLRSWLPTSWERNAGDFDKIFTFLTKRPIRFNEISARLREVLK